MPQPEFLPDEVRDAIAAKIGKLMVRTTGPGPDALRPNSFKTIPRAIHATLGGGLAPTLAESFSVWLLGKDRLDQPGYNLEAMAAETGRWHHQINLSGQPGAFARSVPTGPRAEDWSIREIMESDLAAKLDEAISL